MSTKHSSYWKTVCEQRNTDKISIEAHFHHSDEHNNNPSSYNFDLESPNFDLHKNMYEFLRYKMYKWGHFEIL